MPDSLGFNHEPHRGSVYHRCVECEWPGWGVTVSEADRKRHHLRHLRSAQAEAEKKRLANLAKARKTKRTLDRENALAYTRQEGDA